MAIEIDKMKNFSVPEFLEANPHFYDYLHSLEFKPDGYITMTDGAGQSINVEGRGKFKVYALGLNVAEIKFTKLAEYNPYTNEKTGDILDFKVQVTREEGIFAFRQEVVWKIKNPNEYPCLLYTIRYVFDIDPLEFSQEKQQHNLYNIIESKDFVDSIKYYYSSDDKQELTLKDLKKLRIDTEKLL